MLIGYLGPEGTFSHEAAENYTLSKEARLIEYANIRDVIIAAAAGEVNEGIVPIENSLEGSVNETLDTLVHKVNLYMKGEIVISINQCLLSRPDTSFDGITAVFSHRQALGQCREYLGAHLPKAQERETLSTAEAAKLVSRSEEPWAAIASREAASRFSLQILEENIQDNKGNSTRFAVLGASYNGPTGRDKTSVAFAVDDRPGSLVRVLRIFADAGINLSKIESRPMRTKLGQYLFLVDLAGHCEDEKVSRTLKTVAEESRFYKFLGSYPVFSESGS